MYRWFIVLISTFTCLLSEAQPRYQLDSVVSMNKTGLKQISQQKYDTVSGKLVNQHEIRMDDKRVEGTKHITQYDERGNEVEHIYSDWDSEKEEWMNRERVTKSYDAQDRMLTYTEYEMREGEWVGLAKTEQLFEDRAITTLQYKGGNQWTAVYKNVDMFNDQNVAILSYNYQWDSLSNDWVYWMKYDKTFAGDTLLEESTYAWKDGKWMNSEQIGYVYKPGTDQVSDRLIYIGAEEDWQFKHLIQFRPFDTGQGEEAFYWSVEEDKWKPESFKESYMDKHGRVTDFAAFNWNKIKREYIRAAQGITVYDAKDRITFVQEAQYDDEGKGNNGMQMTLYFDKEDNLYRELHRSFHPRHGWITKRTKEFTFNKDILYKDAQDKNYIVDRAQIGAESLSKNRYAIDRVLIYKHVDGQKVLETESRYYYSPIQ